MIVQILTNRMAEGQVNRLAKYWITLQVLWLVEEGFTQHYLQNATRITIGWLSLPYTSYPECNTSSHWFEWNYLAQGLQGREFIENENTWYLESKYQIFSHLQSKSWTGGESCQYTIQNVTRPPIGCKRKLPGTGAAGDSCHHAIQNVTRPTIGWNGNYLEQGLNATAAITPSRM